MSQKPNRGGKRKSLLPGGIEKPGKPKSEDEAVSITNKNNFYKEYGYQINCQRCIWAYEMNRRGYDVEALPNNDGLGRGKAYMSIAKSYNMEFVNSNPWARTTNKVVAGLVEKKMAAWGEGSRAFIRMSRRSGSGHVFNVEYKNGKVHVYEAQTGEKPASLGKYLSEQKAQPGYVQITRTDNVELKPEEFPRYVKQRGKDNKK